MQLEFTSMYKGFPARIFDTTTEASAFTRELLVKTIPFRIHLVPPNKRRRTALRTVVVLLDATYSGVKVH
tara:strand:- start:9405 stop:9614 length:210 start_codon:yes stop_codon:yes gene_type:complete